MNIITIRRVAAFSLVEVTLSLGIAGFCLLAVFGLLPVGLKSNLSAIEQTNANAILSAVVADLRATPATTTTSGQYQIKYIPLGGATPTTQPDDLLFSNDRRVVTEPKDARYRVKVLFLSPPPTTAVATATTATMIAIKVSWPAAATAANSVPESVQIFTALDRN